MSNSDTKKKRQEQIAKKVEAAGLVPIRNNADSSSPDTKEDQLSLGDLVESILSGDINPEQIDDELKAWINARIDVPYVPEVVEGKALDLAVRVLKSAIIELVE
jgi:hypothetical protein